MSLGNQYLFENNKSIVKSGSLERSLGLRERKFFRNKGRKLSFLCKNINILLVY